MGYSIDIISCITDRFVELTATEKRIAQFILDDVQTAAALPIAEMARLTETSQASITRFARAIGCKDVRELKVKLAQSLAVGQRFIIDVPDLEGVQGIYGAIINVLDINRRALNPDALKKAVGWLSGARQILAFGMGGGSTVCAQELQFRLFRLGLPVVSQSDGLLVRMMAASVAPNDVAIALSLGGFTPDVVESAAIARQYGAKVIAITPDGTPLAQQAACVLDISVEREACPMGLAPTSSAVNTLMMGDALAMALMRQRGFGAEDFARSHPGGSLGARLLNRVHHLMRTGERIPQVRSDATVMEAMLELSRTGLGLVAVCDEQQRVLGVFTDGDLRRWLVGGHTLQQPLLPAVTRPGFLLPAQWRAGEALEALHANHIGAAPVVDVNGTLVGALNLHDLHQAGIG